jgi:hypothetical protein
MNVKRGDIYYADLSPVVGSEQGGVRPVLIVQNDVGNKYSPTVIAAAITSQQDKSRYVYNLSDRKSQSNLDCFCGFSSSIYSACGWFYPVAKCRDCIYVRFDMKKRKFLKILLSVIGICLALTIIHFAYVVYAYEHCSIIYFIGKELWW